jgi:uncharacterized membrane protein
MINDLLFLLTLLSALGCGLMGGFFFAFSAVVMNALARLPLAQGIAAMQSINVAVARSYKVINPWFGAAFFGTAAACVLLAGSSLVTWHGPGAVYLLVGCVLYLVGTVLVTIVFNVPLNEALAAVEPDSGDSAGLWTRYVARWRAWNHVRTAAALAAAASLTIALVTGSAGHLGAAPCARQDFVDTNVAGALNLPEEAVRPE